MSDGQQRWRLVFERGEDARYLAHLDAVKAWERALRRGGVPIALSEGFNPRPRLIFGAPLPLGMLAERELADLYLTERLAIADLRTRLAGNLPTGYRLRDLFDVWVGAPALATLLDSADYRVVTQGADAAELNAAAASLLASDRLDREKHREAKAVAYDLRPLLLHLSASAVPTELRAATLAGHEPGRVADGGPTFALVRMRLRHSQELGSGRAEEVVAALGEALPGGRALAMLHAVRERLWLTDERPTPPDGAPDTPDDRATLPGDDATRPGWRDPARRAGESLDRADDGNGFDPGDRAPVDDEGIARAAKAGNPPPESPRPAERLDEGGPGG